MNATEPKTTVSYYLAISANSWGRGFTIEEAKRSLKRAGGNFRTMLVYRVDCRAIMLDGNAPRVTNDGCIERPHDSDAPVIVVATNKGKTIDPASVTA